MSMKIGWGTKIAFLYGGFVVLIVSLVIATGFKKSQLVAGNYYEQELAYQQRINAAQASANLKEPVQVIAAGDSVRAVFPQQFKGIAVSGSIYFYAPADAGKDCRFNIQTLDAGWAIARNRLPGRHYSVQVSWQAGGKDYYQDIPFNL